MVYFEVCREALPELAWASTSKEWQKKQVQQAVSVTIFPFLSEQSTEGRVATEAISGMSDIAPSFEKLFPGARVEPSTVIAGNELKYVGSDLSRFLASSWRELKKCNVLVTHRNFMANEVLRDKALKGPSPRVGAIPNAGVVLLRITRRKTSSSETKRIFFVRHCTTHHNASRRGDHRLTTCAVVESLRRLAPLLKEMFPEEPVLYGSSILPRAILSCIALQRSVDEADLERLRLHFQPETRASPSEVSQYISAHACGVGSTGSFCSGSRGCWHVQE